MKKILIMGLPGSGKTTLANELVNRLGSRCMWLNADAIREQYNDWDFSLNGRLRQARRMHDLAEEMSFELNKEYVICDFVAPLREMRTIFNADITVWVDTIKEGRFKDTNRLFEIPNTYDIRVTEQDATTWTDIIYQLVESHEKD
jgi:adenylylsulfate kinase